MKKLALVTIAALLLVTVLGGSVVAEARSADAPTGNVRLFLPGISSGDGGAHSALVVSAAGSACTTIQDGTLKRSDGVLIETGYDEWGYNYQARMFNGGYCDAYQNASWCQAYIDVDLIMKWNDAWLSNVDCDDDGLLDRHFGFAATYIGSGAWETNHQAGEYVDDDGKTCKWTYFTKIVAAPADATLTAGVWYAADNTEIGPAIWGEFAIVQEVYNDPCGGFHGISYKSLDHPGFGGW